MVDIEVANRSGVAVDEAGAAELARRILGAEGIEFVRFGSEDVVRHKLVQRIVAAYNEYAEKRAPALRQARRQQG